MKLRFVLLFLFLLFSSGVLGQEQKYTLNCQNTSENTPDCNQLLRLQNREQAVQIARQNYESAVTSLQVEAEKIRQENKWPDTVKFNLMTMAYADTKPPEPPKETPKKP